MPHAAAAGRVCPDASSVREWLGEVAPGELHGFGDEPLRFVRTGSDVHLRPEMALRAGVPWGPAGGRCGVRGFSGRRGGTPKVLR